MDAGCGRFAVWRLRFTGGVHPFEALQPLLHRRKACATRSIRAGFPQQPYKTLRRDHGRYFSKIFLPKEDQFHE